MKSPEQPCRPLNENEVVEAVCKHLEARGMTDVKSCTTKQQGYDIIARYPDSDRLLIIEAKGATSARPGSARFEAGFSRNQVRAHVAKAFYAAAAALQKEAGKADAAIALPDTENHRHFVAAIKSSLKHLGISVLWVNSVGDIDTENHIS